MSKDKSFAQRFWNNLNPELSNNHFVLEMIKVTAIVLAIWLSGIGPAFVTFWKGHQSQIAIACVLYLLIRYLGWVPLAVGALIFSAPLLWLKQRRERSVARV